MTHSAAHHSVQVFSRAKGHSAVAAAAYRAGVSLVDERTGLTHDYMGRQGVESVQVVGWKPDDIGGLWNAAEAAEKRKNSSVARESQLAIPAELDEAERARLARGYALWLRDKYKVAAMVAIHRPAEKGDARNFHAHILFTTREVAEDGTVGAKTRVLDDHKTGSGEILAMRGEWAKRCNSLLEKKGVKKRVDPRSLKQRADEDGTPELPPMPHFGKAATALMRKRDARTKPNTYKPLLRVEQAANEIKNHRDILMMVHQNLMAAKKALEEAEASYVPPALKPAGGGDPKGWPIVDRVKREAAMREALERLRGGTAAPLEWSDPPQDPTDRPRGPQRGRARSR